MLRDSWGDGPVTPKPESSPPIWIGAMSEPAVRRAGRLGDAYLASWATVEEFRQRVAWAREENPDIEVAIVLPAFAWEGGYLPHIRKPLTYYVSCFEKPGGIPESLVAGSPEAVAERMLSYQEAVGGELSFTAEFCWPGLDRGVLSEALAVFGEAVLPLVR